MRKKLVFAVILVCASGFYSFAGVEGTEKGFLADRHAEYGSCFICHDEEKPEAGAFVDWSKCMECHEEYVELGERTKAYGENNPHLSHLGEPDCTICHMGHMESSLYCVSCHNDLDPTMK
jgi:fumarate reductase flavoprotein subunit